jgi:hypothetical protein
MSERGAIKYIERYKQLLSFEGMTRRRNITPMDIDGVIDYNGNAFLYLEAKKENAPFEKGQRMAYENLCKAHEKAKKTSMVICFTHNSEPEEIIDVKNMKVKEVYFNNKWSEINDNRNVLDLVKSFEDYCDKKQINI